MQLYLIVRDPNTARHFHKIDKVKVSTELITWYSSAPSIITG